MGFIGKQVSASTLWIWRVSWYIFFFFIKGDIILSNSHHLSHPYNTFTLRGLKLKFFVA